MGSSKNDVYYHSPFVKDIISHALNRPSNDVNSRNMEKDSNFVQYAEKHHTAVFDNAVQHADVLVRWKGKKNDVYRATIQEIIFTGQGARRRGKFKVIFENDNTESDEVLLEWIRVRPETPSNISLNYSKRLVAPEIKTR